jgi:hypothetical protein
MQSQRVINYIPADIHSDIANFTKEIVPLKSKGVYEIKTYLEQRKMILNKNRRLLNKLMT